MNRSPIQRLLDRGRKAGLGTAELYRALASRLPSAGDSIPGQTDSNGYVARVGANGQRIYTPQGRRA